jgi:NADH:ubiquinone oxidoreductase subunit 4 (subunit M)
VYLIAAFSNSVIGIEGAIILGLAHALVSPGLFICVGGVLYDRTHTRSIYFYRGLAQVMPLFSILFFILCLGNMGTPLTFNFVGEFMSLYGAFERLPMLGALACSSVVLSAAFTIYLFNRVAFGGSYSRYFSAILPDVNKREFFILFILVALTVILGIYPSVILDGLHYSVSTLIYAYDAFGYVSMAFIPLVFLPKRFYSENNKPLSSNNLFSLDPNFITGFTDAEGRFEVVIIKNNRNAKSIKYNYNLCYSIGLHKRDQV